MRGGQRPVSPSSSHPNTSTCTSDEQHADAKTKEKLVEVVRDIMAKQSIET
jgi:hypothetical protein